MDIRESIEQLRRGAAVIEHMVRGLDPQQAHWKHDEKRWSIVEIVNHLADEEREDFRERLRLTLDDPATEWPPIDPEGSVMARGHNGRELEESIRRFLEERANSLAWLASLSDPDLETTHTHPRFGSLSAGDLLLSWVTHDLLHIRQIARTQYAYITERAEPFSAAYAGPLV